MPEDVKVDISGLTSVDQAIKVGDLRLNSKFSIKTDPDTIIVKIEPLAEEEKAEVAPEAGVVTESEAVLTEGETALESKDADIIKKSED
jgi:hypothetical protein